MAATCGGCARVESKAKLKERAGGAHRRSVPRLVSQVALISHMRHPMSKVEPLRNSAYRSFVFELFTYAPDYYPAPPFPPSRWVYKCDGCGCIVALGCRIFSCPTCSEILCLLCARRGHAHDIIEDERKQRERRVTRVRSTPHIYRRNSPSADKFVQALRQHLNAWLHHIFWSSALPALVFLVYAFIARWTAPAAALCILGIAVLSTAFPLLVGTATHVARQVTAEGLVSCNSKHRVSSPRHFLGRFHLSERTLVTLLRCYDAVRENRWPYATTALLVCSDEAHARAHHVARANGLSPRLLSGVRRRVDAR